MDTRNSGDVERRVAARVVSSASGPRLKRISERGIRRRPAVPSGRLDRVSLPPRGTDGLSGRCKDFSMTNNEWTDYEERGTGDRR